MPIRPATTNDASAMAEIFAAAARVAWEAFLGTAPLDAVDRSPGPWERRIAEGGPAWVAEDAAGTVEGFVAVSVERCEVAMLYTAPATWGRGTGGALLAHAERALADAGCTRATLWTEERNTGPRRFYEGRGWRADGEVQERVWQGAPLRELRYAKALIRSG